MAFQSTLPRGSDCSAGSSCGSSFLFQSTLPRGSDNRQALKRQHKQAISIHAPSRERPRYSGRCKRASGISIHAPSRERHINRRALYALFSISIHAPSRERQYFNGLSKVGWSYFNPRSLAGATPNVFVNLFLFLNFNPRSLAGATSHLSCFVNFFTYFNPRSLAGATVLCRYCYCIVLISIHAPSRERPHNRVAGKTHHQRFQSTLPRGSDSSGLSCSPHIF